MFSGFRCFPTQASTLAPEVDNLYFFIIAVTAFFALLVVGAASSYFAIKYRDHTGDEGRRADSPARFRSSSAGRSSRSSSRSAIFVWASIVFFHIVRAAGPDARDLLHRQAVDVALPAHRRPERDQRAARAGRAAPVKVTFTSEDVLHSLFIPGVPREGRRDSRALQLGLVHADEDRRIPPVLRRVLRHEALRA